MSVKTALGGLFAKNTAFTPTPDIPRSNVQDAARYVGEIVSGGTPSTDAPSGAEYLVAQSDAGLSNERVATDTSTIVWDFATLGQAKANWQFLGIEDLTDPAADRGMFWDDSAGAVAWFTPASGLEFVGSYLSITDPDLVAIISEASFATGDVLYHNGTTLARLAAGTDGQFLRTRGTAAAPDWQNVPGGGDLLSVNNLSDLDDAATARTNLGVAIGTNVQAYDATLQSLSLLGTVADRIAYTTALDTWAETTLSSFGRTLIDDADASAAQSTLGLVIGTHVQAYDADLTTWAGLTPSANAQSLVTAANYAAMRALLDLEVGTDFLSPAAIAAAYQPLDGELSALAATVSAADALPYFTGAGTATTTTLTTFARSILDDANEATFKATVNLEIGTDVQAYSSILQNTTASFLTSQETKLGYISITQAVDLDAIETRVNALDAAVVLQGGWDASAGTFPGGGAAQAGWSYIVTVAGTVDGVAFSVNDRLLAYLDNASTTTYAANWLKLDYTDQVLSVAGRTGAVTLTSADLTDVTAFIQTLLNDADAATARATLGTANIAGDTFTGAMVFDQSAIVDQRMVVNTYDRNAGSYGTGSVSGYFQEAAGTGYFNIEPKSGFDAGGSALTSYVMRWYDGSIYHEFYNQGGTDVALADGGTGASLTDPNADRIMFWDDSAGSTTWLQPTNGLEISTTSLQMTAAQRTAEIIFIIDGGGSAITTGVKGYLEIPFACTINSATALADQSGSIVVDVWKDTYANYPPTDADTITASAPVTISSATKSQDSTLTGWTTSIAAGDVLGFNVDSITTCTRVTIALKVTKT